MRHMGHSIVRKTQHPTRVTGCLGIEFYGMVTNIDDNMGKLMQVLDDEGLPKTLFCLHYR